MNRRYPMYVARLSMAAVALALAAAPAVARAERDRERHGHPPSYKLTVIGTFGGTDSTANSINADGTVVGLAVDANRLPQPYRFHGGDMKQLAPLPGFPSGAVADWINGDGDVCGWSLKPGGSEATLWLDAGDPSDLGAAPDGFPLGRCMGIADDPGLAAGLAFDDTHNFARLLAFRAGDVIDISPPYPFSTIFNTNRHGVIAGVSTVVNPTNLFLGSAGFTVDLRHLRICASPSSRLFPATTRRSSTP